MDTVIRPDFLLLDRAPMLSVRAVRTESWLVLDASEARAIRLLAARAHSRDGFIDAPSELKVEFCDCI